ncbi:MAG: acetate--CoA ligase family protein [Candidatus Odinarchaeia archaeon]
MINYKEKIDEEKIINEIRYIIEPRSIAIVGASSDITKVGGIITHNLLTSEYNGKIFLVNPTKKRIYGKKVYKSILEIEEEIDLVEIVVSAKIVPTIMEQASEKKVKGVIIISAGFSEIGNEKLQNKIKNISEKYKMRVIGPNCFGIVNTSLGLDLTFTFTHARKGNISFISQSGAICCGALDWAAKNEMGFAKFINLGNKIDVDEGDILVYLKQDKETEVICLHVEGFKNGRKFYEIAKKVTKIKPIIAIKTGITEAGSRASKSHTGSLVGNEEIINAAFKQAGIIRVHDIDCLFDAAIAFSTQPLPRGKNVAIVTNAGGIGVITTDWLTTVGLKVPVLKTEIQEKIKNKIIEIGAPFNPVDMTGSAGYKQYYEVIKILMSEPEIHIIVPIFVSQGLVTSDEPANAVVDAANIGDKTILSFWVGGTSILEGVNILKRNRIPCFHSAERLSKIAKAMYDYFKFNNNLNSGSK